MTNAWHTDNFKSVTSQLTGNTISINLDERLFLVRPEEHWDWGILMTELEALKVSARWSNRSARSLIFLATVEPLFLSPGFENLCRTLNVLMIARGKWSTKIQKGSSLKESYAIAKPWCLHDKTRIAELMTGLWRAGVLALPRNLPELHTTVWKLKVPWYSEIEAITREAACTPHYIGQLLAKLDDLLSRLCPVREPGDLIPDVLNAFPEFKGNESRRISTALVRILEIRHGNLPFSEDAYWPKLPTLEADTVFSWAIRADPGLEAWAMLAAEWLSESKTALSSRIYTLRRFLQTLIGRPNLPREPQALFQCPNGQLLNLGLDSLHRSGRNLIADFLDWVIATRFTTERTDGFPVPFEGVRNPVERRKTSSALVESVRNVMPPHLLDMMIETLTEDDWSWARTAVGSPSTKNKGDWFAKIDPKTNEAVWIWSPARVVCLYGKLAFPSRTLQMRHLDSGEADLKIAAYDSEAPENRRWRMVPNLAPVQRRVILKKPAGRAARKQEPVLRGAVQVEMSAQRHHLRLRFSSNKTADLSQNAWNHGYTAPWMPEELAHKLIRLREWQRKYNPIATTTPWTEVQEFKFGNHAKHPEVIRDIEPGSTEFCASRSNADARRRGLPAPTECRSG